MKNWSDYQKAVFNWVECGTGSAVVEAVAGSGKTTTLVEAVRRMKGEVALMAFNRKMADELQSRTAGFSGVNANTVHAFGLKAFKLASLHPRVDGNKVRDLCQRMVPENLSGFVVCLVGLAKDAGIGFLAPISDSAEWQRLVDHHDLSLEDDSTSVEDGIACAQRVLAASNADIKNIDFSDMIYLPLIRGMKLPQFDWVLVDEAQDTNATRRALAKAMLKPGGRLLAVGDPRQAIFGFTGADADSLDLIRRDFGAVTMPLSVCYRCGTEILNLARQFNPAIEAGEGNPKGEVQTLPYEDFTTGLEAYGLTGKDGIICRKNAPLIELAFGLIRRGIGCRVEGRDIGKGLIALARKWKVQSLNTLSTRIETYREREVAKAIAKGQETKAEQIQDKVEALQSLIQRCQSLNQHSVRDLVTLIDSMFSDSTDANPRLVTLSSVHKSKGLEWDRVFLLGRNKFMPSPFARQAWQKGQESNLIYVALTRARQTLVEILVD
jgi:DNA helicase-2/ATP-dependent DNA helicase PcrA